MAIEIHSIQRQLRATESRLRWTRALRFVLMAGIGSLAVFILFLGLDTTFHLGAGGRWTGFLLIVIALGFGCAAGFRVWRRRISDAAVARCVESASDEKENPLISAVQLDRQLANQPALRHAIFAEMTDPFPRTQWDRVFDARRLRRLGVALSAAVVFILGWAMVQPARFANSAKRVLLPTSSIAPMTRTKIVGITPGSGVVVHGRPVLVDARLAGEIPKVAWIHFKQEGSSWQRMLMTHEAGQPSFGFEFKDVRKPFEYYITAGDAESATHQLAVRPRTAIVARSAKLEFPGYTGIPAKTLVDFNAVENLVPGSKVTFTIDFNNELESFAATEDKGSQLDVQRLSASRWTFAYTAAASRALKLVFKDTMSAVDEAVLQVAVRQDEAPRIAITVPAEGQQLAAMPGAMLTLKFTVEDDFGIGAVSLMQGSHENEDALIVQGFEQANGKKRFEGVAQVKLTAFEGEDRVTLRLRAADTKEAGGPGVTISRPIVVSMNSADKLEKQLDDAAAKLTKGLETLIKLQEENLQGTRVVMLKKETTGLTSLVDREVKIAADARELAASAGAVAPKMREELRALAQREMQDATLALRNATGAEAVSRGRFLANAATIQAMILAKLRGAPSQAEAEAERNQIATEISAVEELLKRQRDIHRETKAAGAEKFAALAKDQDSLAERATSVRQSVEKDSKNASLGDADFRARLAKVAVMFGEIRVYEDMLSAAEHLEGKEADAALPVQARVIANLAKMVELLNQWQLAEAEKQAEELKKEAEGMAKKLEKLAELQREIVEKTKDMARKNEFRPEDLATAQEMREQRDLMKDVVEKMVTDMQAFPDMKPGNEMKGELVQIFEDVIQADKQEVAEGKLKPNEIAVQKEQGILDAIAQAKEIAADMEMWLPNKNEREKWLMENFDKTEMPEIPNLPLADAFEDLVGNLLDQQEDLEQDIQDAASNQAMAMNPANGWEVRDGPMPGFGAQGKSGNEKPNHNEQMGRSSGGREGMSDGEMAGDTANSLKGDKPDARRTKDPLQQGQVKDAGEVGETRATGGGKAGGFSDRQGMEGNAPLRPVNAPKTQTTNALAVEQALVREKTAKTVAQASMLYLRGDSLAEVTRLMSENEGAIREGRYRDAAGLHQRIVGRLREIKNGLGGGEVVAFSTTESARAQEKRLLGGSESDAPAQYKEQVADYFRSLVEEK